jgi:hypothetical protein
MQSGREKVLGDCNSEGSYRPSHCTEQNSIGILCRRQGILGQRHAVDVDGYLSSCQRVTTILHHSLTQERLAYSAHEMMAQLQLNVRSPLLNCVQDLVLGKDFPSNLTAPGGAQIGSKQYGLHLKSFCHHLFVNKDPTAISLRKNLGGKDL